jgi:putative nucleotidyltransferase with HDIG domain
LIVLQHGKRDCKGKIAFKELRFLPMILISGRNAYVITDFAKKIENVINFIPPIPVVIIELLKALEDENSNMNSIARIIAKDPPMSMNVLKVANSAFYRLTNKVATVDHAVNMLGVKEIGMICVSCGAYQALKPPAEAGTFDLKEFWKHSVATGVIARQLCKELSIGDRNTIYFGGLLHDIGKIVLDRFAHEVYRIVIQITHEECTPMIEAEKRIIGESHETIGGLLMEKWKFPHILVDIARYHHNLSSCPESSRPSVAVCALADELARVRYYGFGGDASGIILEDTEAFRILSGISTSILNIDIFKFIYDLEMADGEIAEMEALLTG